MLTITGIYAAVDAKSNDKLIKFSGHIDSETLLNPERKDHPDEFYLEIGRLVIDQFNDEKNWI